MRPRTVKGNAMKTRIIQDEPDKPVTADPAAAPDEPRRRTNLAAADAALERSAPPEGDPRLPSPSPSPRAR
jgi:hypothetical protein